MLGVVQGVAEVVPVSSSAQLVLVPLLLGWPQPGERTAFAAALHAGSTAGVSLALRRELLDLPRTRSGRRTLAMLAASCVPAAVAGAVGARVVEERLGRPAQLAPLLAGTGALLWLADRRPQDVGTVGPGAAAAAAVAQAAALVPGVSRAGATLTALRLCRVERAEAARFSLLMSLPVTAGAAVLSLGRAGREGVRGLAAPLAAGVPAAAVSGAAACAAWRRRPACSATGPALYRLGVAAAVAVRLRRPPPEADPWRA